MTPLEKAKALFVSGTYTCVVSDGETVYTDTANGVRPLLALINSGTNLVGFAAADRIVGRAAALLYAYMGVTALYAQVLSEGALAVCRARGIAVEYETLTATIRNRAGDGPCPMESAVAGTEDPATALQCIRDRVRTLAAGR